MKRKKRQTHDEINEIEQRSEQVTHEETPEKVEHVDEVEHTDATEQVEEVQVKTHRPKHNVVDHRPKKFKPAFARVSVDPTRQYRTPESRESWGPNVKGKKFRKEKGKKKRCQNAGCIIDGSVKSVRLDV